MRARAEGPGGSGRAGRAVFASVVMCALSAPVARADPPLTLAQVLARARRYNATLPIAGADRAIAAERIREARGRLFPRASIEALGGYQSPPAAFNTASHLAAALQLVWRESLYDGGRLRAELAIARSDYAAAAARLRTRQRDVDFMVRSQFSELVAADKTIGVRRRGIARLSTYLQSIKNRRAAGQGVTADLLKTEVELDRERAQLIDTQQRRAEARLTLNNLMGRDPSAPLAVMPPPPPSQPPPLGRQPWRNTPDLAAAEADLRAALAGIDAARAGRRPSLSLEAGAGVVEYAPTTSGSFIDNVTDGLGGSVILSVSWPIWDFGLYHARLRRAEIDVTRAGWNVIAVRRQVRLAYEGADTRLAFLRRKLDLLSRTVPKARDSYLTAESEYRGGAGTALDVLNAFSAWMDAETAYIDAILRYRIARAGYIRWGSP